MAGQVEECLRIAKQKIERPEAWTQGTFARDKNGEATGPSSCSATCWCASGAVRLAAGMSSETRVAANHTLTSALRVIPGCDQSFVPDWNDDPCRRHIEVLTLFDSAIVRAKEKGI